MKQILILTVCCIAAESAFADCELLSMADAELVLGPNVTDLSGEDAQFQCMFIGGAPQGTFIVQFADRSWFNQVRILEPHAAVDVGEEGRSNVDTNGVVALQFVQGNRSATLSVRPSSATDRDYLAALETVGKRLAERFK